MARGRKPAVTSVERRRWLEELEGRKGITQISKAAGRDIRVVKRHIGIAREEREIAKTRSDFLLSRLEQHQEDLLADVRRLRQQFSQHPLVALHVGDALQQKIHEAFKEHTGRLSFWQLVKSHETVVSEYQETQNDAQSQFADKEAQLVSHFPQEVAIFPWSTQLVWALKEETPLRGSTRRYDNNKDTEGYCRPCWSGKALVQSQIPEAILAPLLKAHGELLAYAERYEPLFRSHHQRLQELANLIVDELDVFVLKRLVPGRCRYCPV